MWLRPAVLAALVMTALALPAAASAGDSAGWQAYRAKDYGQAEAIWQRDAAKGDSNAMFGLAVLAEKAGDQSAASGWYEKAARAGLASAQVLIGQRYATGTGVAADPVMAYAWYSRAIDARVPNAEKVRAALAAGMSPEAIQKATALAETLKTK